MGYLMGTDQKLAAGKNEPREWYAVDKMSAADEPKKPMKVVRLYVGDRGTAAKMAGECASGIGLVDETGEPVEPGEIKEAPFYRLTMIDAAMAHDWREGCKIDGCTGAMLTLAEAAEKSGTRKQSIWERIQRKRMAAEIVGGTWRVLDATLALWVPQR